MLAKGVDTVIYLKNFRLEEIWTVTNSQDLEGQYEMDRICRTATETEILQLTSLLNRWCRFVRI
jgi:hypothetical protein